MVNTKIFRKSNPTGESHAISECLNEANFFIEERKIKREDIIEYRTRTYIENKGINVNSYCCEVIITCWFA